MFRHGFPQQRALVYSPRMGPLVGTFLRLFKAIVPGLDDDIKYNLPTVHVCENPTQGNPSVRLLSLAPTPKCEEDESRLVSINVKRIFTPSICASSLQAVTALRLGATQ